VIVFDIETDGLLNDCTQIHCLIAYDTEAKETYTYSDSGTKEPVVRGVQLLADAVCIAGHNIIGYDIPVLRKFYPWFDRTTGMVDTLLLSRLLHPNLIDIDKRRQWPHMPLQLYGRHSLEAYGHRLGEYKGDFSKSTDWKQFSPEMEEYCKQDVVVTTKLCKHFATRLNG
jgi:hypothetical protein